MEHEREAEHPGEDHTESQSTEDGELCESEGIELSVSCRRGWGVGGGKSQPVVSLERGGSSIRTGFARYDCEVFDGTRTCVQHPLSVVPEKLQLKLDRAKVHPVSKFVDEVHRPLSQIVETC